MSRSRNIKPGFFKNDVLAECEPLARILFAGLWCEADREGRLEDRPKKIRAECLPYDACDIEFLLDQLANHGFILRYEVGGIPYIQVLAFDKHQNPHKNEAASSIPAPELHRTSTVQVPNSSGALRLIPDSLNLIPDSLEEIAPAPQSPSPDEKVKRSPTTFSAWYASVPEDAPVVSDTHAIFRYAKEVGIPADFLALAWAVFEDKFMDGTKRQKDWPATFANYVKGNYLKLWWVDNGSYVLSNTGRQAMIAWENGALNSFEKKRPSIGDEANLTGVAA